MHVIFSFQVHLYIQYSLYKISKTYLYTLPVFKHIDLPLQFEILQLCMDIIFIWISRLRNRNSIADKPPALKTKPKTKPKLNNKGKSHKEIKSTKQSTKSSKNTKDTSLKADTVESFTGFASSSSVTISNKSLSYPSPIHLPKNSYKPYVIDYLTSSEDEVEDIENNIEIVENVSSNKQKRRKIKRKKKTKLTKAVKKKKGKGTKKKSK